MRGSMEKQYSRALNEIESAVRREYTNLEEMWETAKAVSSESNETVEYFRLGLLAQHPEQKDFIEDALEGDVIIKRDFRLQDSHLRHLVKRLKWEGERELSKVVHTWGHLRDYQKKVAEFNGEVHDLCKKKIELKEPMTDAEINLLYLKEWIHYRFSRDNMIDGLKPENKDRLFELINSLEESASDGEGVIETLKGIGGVSEEAGRLGYLAEIAVSSDYPLFFKELLKANFPSVVDVIDRTGDGTGGSLLSHRIDISFRKLIEGLKKDDILSSMELPNVSGAESTTYENFLNTCINLEGRGGLKKSAMKKAYKVQKQIHLKALMAGETDDTRQNQTISAKP